MNLPNEKQLKEFRQWGAEPPEHIDHGEDNPVNPISSKLKSGNPRDWFMEGPGILKCETDFGPMTQFLGPNVICLGIDEKGLPILKELL